MFHRFTVRFGKGIKLLFTCSVLLYILLLLYENPASDTGGSCFNLPCALFISAGFAISFRMMLCCRKKV